MKTEAVQRILDFGARRIPYRLHWADRPRLRLVVCPNLAVDVHAPVTATEDKVLAAVRKKAPWICRAIERAADFQPLPCPKKYVSGETFMFLGRQYRLRVEQGRSNSARLYGRFLEVTVRNRGSTAEVGRILQRWYMARAAAIFTALIAKCRSVGARHGIPAAKLLIRKMRTRWGSCTTASRITLNVSLVQTPMHCIEYVIMHELCHLMYHNHSQAFYRLLNRCMPDWKQRKRTLDQIALPSASLTIE